MASNINAPTTKGNEKLNADGKIEKKVDTVDYRSPAGPCKDAKKEDVQVIHESEPGAAKSGGGGLAGAKAAVTKTFESAKDAMSGKKKDNKTCEK